MDLPKASPLELGMTANLDRYHIGPIPVEAEAEGEELKEEVQEITDEETVESLEGIEGMDGVENQLKFQVNKNAEDIQHLSSDVSEVKTAVMGTPGAPGYIQRTEEMFKDLKQDNKEGFRTIHALLKSMDETLLFMQGENKKKIEANEKCIEDLTERMEAMEDRHKEEDENRKENRAIVKKAVFGAALGGGGLTGVAIAAVKGWISRGGN